ncbi:hypothetical protein HAX54_002224, partial [Datura stramonium]|nr:hypothetical protein [Datura stramonium]
LRHDIMLQLLRVSLLYPDKADLEKVWVKSQVDNKWELGHDQKLGLLGFLGLNLNIVSILSYYLM